MHTLSAGSSQIHWKMLLVKFAIWLVAEVVLSLYGLDNIADYSEYLFRPRIELAISIVTPQSGIA